jgi:hypothetical protein
MHLRNPLPAILCAILLAGCTPKIETVTPSVRIQMMADLEAGNLTLDCTFACSFAWLRDVKYMHTLDLAERWEDLAVEVMKVGHRRDLNYYYLGQAAQGLGYHASAIKYYQIAAAMANGTDNTTKCASVRNACQGVDLFSSIPVLIGISQEALERQRLAERQKPPPVAKAPALKNRADSGWVMPAPSAK